MRKLFVPTLLALGFIAAVNAADPSMMQTGSLTTAAVAQQNEGGGGGGGTDFKANVDIDAGTPGRTETTSTTWSVDPLWIALAVGAIVLIAILFAAGSRGGGTTIVKD